MIFFWVWRKVLPFWISVHKYAGLSQHLGIQAPSHHILLYIPAQNADVDQRKLSWQGEKILELTFLTSSLEFDFATFTLSFRIYLVFLHHFNIIPLVLCFVFHKFIFTLNQTSNVPFPWALDASFELKSRLMFPKKYIYPTGSQWFYCFD